MRFTHLPRVQLATYAEVNRVAHFLLSRGLERGDTLALYMCVPLSSPRASSERALTSCLSFFVSQGKQVGVPHHLARLHGHRRVRLMFTPPHLGLRPQLSPHNPLTLGLSPFPLSPSSLLTAYRPSSTTTSQTTD